MGTKVCAIERTHGKEKTYCSVFGWRPLIEQAMTWPERKMADQHMSSMVLPPGVIRVIEVNAPDEEKPAPEVRTDYDPFGYGA